MRGNGIFCIRWFAFHYEGKFIQDEKKAILGPCQLHGVVVF